MIKDQIKPKIYNRTAKSKIESLGYFINAHAKISVGKIFITAQVCLPSKVGCSGNQQKNDKHSDKDSRWHFYQCNQQCLHCHVDASPHRTEMMTDDNVKEVITWSIIIPVYFL